MCIFSVIIPVYNEEKVIKNSVEELLESIEKVFGSNIPHISSTKSLTGHALGAAGVHEIIYSIIMMNANFIAASANITELDPAAAQFPIVQERIDTAPHIVMSNSFGFGGTNATLIIKKFDE